MSVYCTQLRFCRVQAKASCAHLIFIHKCACFLILKGVMQQGGSSRCIALWVAARVFASYNRNKSCSDTGWKPSGKCCNSWMCVKDLLIYFLQEITGVLRGNSWKMANVILSDTVFNHAPAPMACMPFLSDLPGFGFEYLQSSCRNLNAVTIKRDH